MQDINEKLSKLHELVSTFKANIKQYKSSAYDEANTRVDYIDKFFELLDWDVRNTQGFSEQYREVVREDKVIIQGKPKAPDYSFRIGGYRKFFVEAKKPAVHIKEDTEPAFQIRRYSYTAKLPLAILTDFEEFAVYDTRIKPNKDDKASTARIFYCTYEEYEKNFEFIYNTFSKTAILKGSFDRYIEENKNKKGTSEVDKEFLKMIEWWREILARTIALRNKEIDLFNLNYAVQKIIDRIIFLRIAEDRQMEEYSTLYNLIKEDNIYASLNKIFKKANDKYNSGLFKIEDWLLKLQIDEKILVKIIKGLYYPDSPYEFSVLPIEILGHIYEQFLGKTIRLTKSHQAKVEEKPEVRKAGGVYYTPQYIVDYIVKNTVGEKIKNKTPKEIEKLTILDPACGSGSFLVGAYSFLLKYHLDYYTNAKNKQKALKNNKIYQVDDNTYKLSIEEKQKILLNNIYGVDIDSQAVEVTKLSLLLKLMEDENVESKGELFRHSDLKLLPDLSNNIKCGNSLIGSDYFKDKNLSLFGDDEMRKINPFDWDKEFPGIFKNGGFDVVIGNPPYVNISILEKESYNYIEKKYRKIHTGYNDIMYYFIFKGIQIINTNGIFGFITSNYYLGNSYARPLRNFLKNYIKKIINFKDFLVFKDANVHTNIIIAHKNPKDKNVLFFIKDNQQEINTNDIEMNLKSFILDRNKLKENWIIGEDNTLFLINKIKEKSTTLGEISIIEKGSTSGKNEIFTVSYEFAKNNKLETDLLRKNIKSGDIIRYYIKERGNYLIYIDNSTNIEKYPNIFNYLKSHKKELAERNEVKKGLYKWYRLERPRKKEIFDVKEKLVVPYRANKNKFAYDNKQFFNDGGDVRVIVIKPDVQISIKYILGILNSSLMNWYYGFIGKPKGNMREYFNEPMCIIPIKNIDFSNFTEKEQHDKLIYLVNQMLEFQKQFHSAKTDYDKKMYQKKIEIINKQIDDLVYKLYGLTDEEIKIVEGDK